MKTIKHEYKFVVMGGGLAGICAAVTAARGGMAGNDLLPSHPSSAVSV